MTFCITFYVFKVNLMHFCEKILNKRKKRVKLYGRFAAGAKNRNKTWTYYYITSVRYWRKAVFSSVNMIFLDHCSQDLGLGLGFGLVLRLGLVLELRLGLFLGLGLGLVLGLELGLTTNIVTQCRLR